jgi:hypothetical protein
MSNHIKVPLGGKRALKPSICKKVGGEG